MMVEENEQAAFRLHSLSIDQPLLFSVHVVFLLSGLVGGGLAPTEKTKRSENLPPLPPLIECHSR